MKNLTINIRVTEADKAKIVKWARGSGYGNTSEAIRHTVLSLADESREQGQAAA